jgi:hypothetical protein
MLDFGGLFASFKDKVKYYRDLSPSGDYVEAIGRIYDELRWAETKQDAQCVLIAHLKALQEQLRDSKGEEHRDALFDRIFRATSGKEL